jgi:ApaG protein
MYTPPLARAVTSGIDVMVQSAFVGERPTENGVLYLHRYEVLIRNTTERDVQLLARKWQIADLGQPVEKVEGRGVIGVEPVIRAHSGYSYVSGAALRSPLGAMEGMYWFADLARKERFWVAIPQFQLEVPWVWN